MQPAVTVIWEEAQGEREAFPKELENPVAVYVCYLLVIQIWSKDSFS